jgi:hypothetical protein
VRRLRAIPAWAAALALVLLAGGVARAVVAASPGRFSSADERAYSKLAAGLADHASYEAPRMDDPLHWAPGTPVLLAAGRLVAGVHGQYWAQFVVGVGLIALVFVLARMLAGPWAGVAASAAVASYPPLAVITGDLVSEPLGALTLVGAVTAMAWALRAPATSWRFAVAGAAVGVAILARADLLVLPLVLAILVAVETQGWRAPALYLLAALLVLAPWSAYATSRAGHFVPVTSASWSTLYVGTHLPADGRVSGLRRVLADETRAHNPRLRGISDQNLRAEWILDAVAARHPGLGRSAALQAETKRNLRRYALGRPVDFAAMEVRKLGRMWLGYNRGTHHNQRMWILAIHLALVAASLAGLLYGLVRTRHRVLLAIALTILTATAVSVAFVAQPRHNTRLMPLLIAGGAAGLALSHRARAARSGPPRTAGARGGPRSASSRRAAAARR